MDDARAASDLISSKLRLFTYYRSSVTTSLVSFGLISDPKLSPSGFRPEVIALQELSHIFPKLVQKLTSSLGKSEDITAALPIELSQRLSQSLPARLSTSSSVSQTYPFPSYPTPQLTDSPARSLTGPEPYQAMAVPSCENETSYSVMSNAAVPTTDQAYSLPFQAMMSLSETMFQQPEMDTSRIFDSATW